MGRAPGRAGLRAAAVALVCVVAAAAVADPPLRSGGGPATKPPAASPAKTPAPPTTLEVVVTDAAGKPIEGAFVLAVPAVSGFARRDMTSWRSTLTGGGGRARLESMPTGPWRVRAHARGYVDRYLGRVASGPLTVQLERGGVVTGTVRTADGGRPIAGARVRLGDELPLPLAWQQEAMRVESATDERGRFRLDGIGKSPVRLVARASGYAASERGDVRAGEAVEIFLFPGASLSGTVRDDAGQPVAGAAVRADGDRGRSHAEASDAQGTFTMAGIEPGEYVVLASGGSRAPAISSVVVAPEAEATPGGPRRSEWSR